MATLVLEDGTTFRGRLFGANVSVSGEVGKSLQVLANLQLHVAVAASCVMQKATCVGGHTLVLHFLEWILFPLEVLTSCAIMCTMLMDRSCAKRQTR